MFLANTVSDYRVSERFGHSDMFAQYSVSGVTRFKNDTIYLHEIHEEFGKYLVVLADVTPEPGNQ